MDQKFEDGQQVKIKGQADFKYNNRRSGAVGVVNDIYYSEKYGEFVYEIDFSERSSGYDLIHECDLEAL